MRIMKISYKHLKRFTWLSSRPEYNSMVLPCDTLTMLSLGGALLLFSPSRNDLGTDLAVRLCTCRQYVL